MSQVGHRCCDRSSATTCQSGSGWSTSPADLRCTGRRSSRCTRSSRHSRQSADALPASSRSLSGGPARSQQRYRPRILTEIGASELANLSRRPCQTRQRHAHTDSAGRMRVTGDLRIAHSGCWDAGRGRPGPACVEAVRGSVGSAGHSRCGRSAGTAAADDPDLFAASAHRAPKCVVSHSTAKFTSSGAANRWHRACPTWPVTPHPAASACSPMT